MWNVFNYLGAASSGLIQWPRGTGVTTQLIILVIAVLRVVFIPLFMFCNLAPSVRENEVGTFS